MNKPPLNDTHNNTDATWIELAAAARNVVTLLTLRMKKIVPADMEGESNIPTGTQSFSEGVHAELELPVIAVPQERE